MWLTRLSIQRPVFVIVLMASLFVMGLFSRSRMQVEERPRVDIVYTPARCAAAQSSGRAR